MALKREVVQEYLTGETLHGLACRHDLSCPAPPSANFIVSYTRGCAPATISDPFQDDFDLYLLAGPATPETDTLSKIEVPV